MPHFTCASVGLSLDHQLEQTQQFRVISRADSFTQFLFGERFLLTHGIHQIRPAMGQTDENAPAIVLGGDAKDQAALGQGIGMTGGRGGRELGANRQLTHRDAGTVGQIREHRPLVGGQLPGAQRGVEMTQPTAFRSPQRPVQRGDAAYHGRHILRPIISLGYEEGYRMFSFDESPDDVVEVLNIVPLQGPAGIVAPSCEAAISLAAKEINSGTGILGREVRVTTLDGGRSPAAVADEVSALLATGLIDAITGWHISAVRQAVAQVTAGRVPYLFANVYEELPNEPAEVVMIGEAPSGHILG